MHYALNFRTFLFSHYFYTGLRIACGVIGLTLMVYGISTLAAGMTVAIGALCTSLMDHQPSPLRHKFNEMLASAILCSLITLIITLCAPFHWLLNIMLVVISFLACMMVVFGKKTLPLQFSALFMMTVSLQNDLTVLQAFEHTALVLLGGLGYMGYSVTVSWYLRRRIKQQVLAEALFDLARYIEIKADFYDIHVDLSQQFNQLVRQQIVLAEKQQLSRDMILRPGKRDRDVIQVQIHYAMLELYELVLSTHTDYALLRSHLGGHDILTYLRDLISKTASDIGAIAYDVTRNKPSLARISYKAETRAIELELEHLEEARAAGKISDDALAVVRTSWTKVRDVIEMVAQLHVATQVTTGPLPILPGVDMTPFLSQQKYEWALLRQHLRWSSPIFRYSMRMAMAVTTGLFIANHLPYASHGYWILLTLVVILKPSFSITRQRRTDRIVGTLIGCVFTAGILHYVHVPLALLGVLFLATIAGPAFSVLKYRYTAIAASMQALLQINLLVPEGSTIIVERLLDTLIGAAIATAFSFVLPSWEWRALPRLVGAVLKSNQLYIEASSDLTQGKVADDFPYRLARKRFMESLAGLSAALVRMLDEPMAQQRGVEDINQFIVQNYLMVSHVAAIRLLLRRHAQGIPREPVNGILQHTASQVVGTLVRAQAALGEAGNPASFGTLEANEAPAVALVVTESADAADWSGWERLQRRARLLLADSRKIAVRSAAIGRALS
ncbi:MAG: FUSC family membrane protein [Janthinobacterium lividum]